MKAQPLGWLGRSAQSFAALLLFASAAVQLNDPDALFWVILYGLAAMVPAALAVSRPLPSPAISCALGLCLAGVLLSTTGFFSFLSSGEFGQITGEMSAGTFVEPAREFLGALIALVIVAACWRASTR